MTVFTRYYPKLLYRNILHVSRLAETHTRVKFTDCHVHPKSTNPVVISCAKNNILGIPTIDYCITKMTAATDDNNGPTPTKRNVLRIVHCNSTKLDDKNSF